MRRAITLGLFVLTTGCADDLVRPEPPLATVDLRAAMHRAEGDVTPVGVAIAPDGARYFFDELLGLYRLDGALGTPIVRMEDMPDPGPTAPIKLPYTDLVALGENQFALTAIGDGFILDTAAMTLQQHFCYLPDTVPVSLVQRTDAITYDPTTETLYAQPVTYDAAGVLQYAQLATYERATGVDTAWFSVGNGVAATGMVVMPNVGLVLGQGSTLTRFDRANEVLRSLDDLERFGVRSIDGLAIDGDTLVVVDKQTDTMFDIALSQLSL